MFDPRAEPSERARLLAKLVARWDTEVALAKAMAARPGHRQRSRFTGLRAWWAQRLGAVGMLAFLVFVLVSMAIHPLAGYAQWRAWMAHPGITLAFLLFFAALLSHMWVGLRDVLLD